MTIGNLFGRWHAVVMRASKWLQEMLGPRPCSKNGVGEDIETAYRLSLSYQPVSDVFGLSLCTPSIMLESEVR